MMNIRKIKNSKSFSIKDFENWPLDYIIVGDLFAHGIETFSLLEFLMKHDDYEQDKKNKNIINFVFHDEFFSYKGKLYFEKHEEIYNFDTIPYSIVVAYGIKEFLHRRKYASLSTTWWNVFFYLLNNRFSTNVESVLKKENFFEKCKHEIFQGFIYGFRELQGKKDELLESSPKYQQNLLRIFLYLQVEKKYAEKLISNFNETNNVNEIITYLKKLQTSFQK